MSRGSKENIEAVKNAIVKHPVLKDVVITGISVWDHIFPRDHFIDIYGIRLRMNKDRYEQALGGIYDEFTDTEEKLIQTKSLVEKLEKVVSDLTTDISENGTGADVQTSQGEYFLFMTGDFDRIITFIHFDTK